MEHPTMHIKMCISTSNELNILRERETWYVQFKARQKNKVGMRTHSNGRKNVSPQTFKKAKNNIH